jgi:radical SAM peptide maturase (CXXX-repeat target family)
MVNRKHFEQYQDWLCKLIAAKDTMEGKPQSFDENSDIKGTLIKTITFQVTDSCNLQCTYCYQINKGKRVMSFDVAKKFIDLLIKESYDESSYVSIKSTPGIIIEFIGGEPLLEIDLIDKITDYFRFRLIQEHHPWARYFYISMISNGVEYFDSKVQNYIKKNNRRLCFGISLDGCKDLHDMCRVFPDGLGSYDIAEAGCIYHKKHYDKNMLTKMTIAPENITWMYEAFLNLLKLEYYVIHANCVYEKGWTINHAIVFYDQLKKIADYILENNLENDLVFTLFDEMSCIPQSESDNQNYCGSTGCMLICDPDGVIAPCVRFLKSSLGEELGDFALGHINSGIGKEACHKCNICTLDSITRKSQSTDECWNCPISMSCGWCTALNYQELGTPNARCTYICWMHRARSLANVYYWNQVYKKNNENKAFPLYLEKEHALQIITEEEYNMLLELSKGAE